MEKVVGRSKDGAVRAPGAASHMGYSAIFSGLLSLFLSLYFRRRHRKGVLASLANDPRTRPAWPWPLCVGKLLALLGVDLGLSLL